MNEVKLEKIKSPKMALIAVILAYIYDCMIVLAMGAYLTLPGLRSDIGIRLEDLNGVMGIQSSMFLIGLSVGTFIAGWAGDKYGRARTFIALFYLEGVSAILMAFTQNIVHFYINRFVMGLFTAGVWPIAIAYVSEIWGVETRGKAVGLGSFGSGIGELASYFILLPLALLITWQGGFIALAIAAIGSAIFFQKYITEPEVWLKLSTKMNQDIKTKKKAKSTYRQLFATDIRKYTILATLGDITKNMIGWAVRIWVPVYLATLGFKVEKIIWIAGAFSVASILGIYFWSTLSDRHGRRPILKATAAFGFLALLMIAVIAPELAKLSYLMGQVTFWIGYILFGFSTTGMVGPWGAYMSELYPTRVRATGNGFSHGIARCISAIVVGIIGLGLLNYPKTQLSIVFLIVGGILQINMFIVAHIGPETAKKELDFLVA